MNAILSSQVSKSQLGVQSVKRHFIRGIISQLMGRSSPKREGPASDRLICAPAFYRLKGKTEPNQTHAVLQLLEEYL